MIRAILLVLSLSASARADDNIANLMSAAYNGSLPDVKAAVKRGADLNMVDEDGETALMYAVSGGHDDIVAYLLSKHADPDALSAHGDTALFYAALKDRAGAASLLLKKGAKSEARNANGATPLIVAASHGSKATAQLLIGSGADINARGADGSTVLMTSTLNAQDELATLLIDKGADINAHDNAGSTALIAAAFNGRAKVARLLIDKGADVTAADSHSETAVEYAKASGNYAIADMISEVLNLKSADKDKLRQAELEREAQARQAEVAKEAEAAEKKRQAAERQQKYLLGAAGAAVLILIAGFLKYSADARRRKTERKKQREIDAKNVQALAATDAHQGYEALLAYEKEYHDRSVFPAEVLLKLYEARDRAKQSTPEKVARRKADQSQTESAARVRHLLKADPREALEALRDYVEKFGNASPFTGEELGRLYDLGGREGELLSGALALSPEQSLGLAVYLSGRDRSEAAIRLISAEPLLSQTIRIDEGCDQVIGIYDHAGVLPNFFELCASKSHEFIAAYARTFLAMGRPAECLKTLNLARVKDRDDQAIAAAALVYDGKRDEAVKAIEDIPKAAWSYTGWGAFMQFCLKTGRWEEAREALDHVGLLRPLRRDAKLHYVLGLACEEAGRADMAGEIFHAFARAGLDYKDALARAARLPKPPETVRRALEPDAPQSSSTRVGGRYDLRSEIGKGDLGTVISAYDSTAGRKMALKKLRPEIAGDPKERGRFLHQAKLVSRLDHPAIIGIREILEDGGDVYLVYDFAEGQTLANLLAQKKRLSLIECKNVLEPVCQALDHGHLRNILHLALTPGNIMVGADGRGKLMDFGLARVARPADHYTAPEARVGAPSRACDVYSLGVIVCEMATGALPSPGVSVRALVHGLPREMDAMLAAALNPDPKERVNDPLEFSAELKRLSVL